MAVQLCKAGHPSAAKARLRRCSLSGRGSSSKEAAADLVLACLGEREVSGRVVNLRLAGRKCRGAGPRRRA